MGQGDLAESPRSSYTGPMISDVACTMQANQLDTGDSERSGKTMVTWIRKAQGDCNDYLTYQANGPRKKRDVRGEIKWNGPALK